MFKTQKYEIPVDPEMRQETAEYFNEYVKKYGKEPTLEEYCEHFRKEEQEDKSNIEGD